MIKIAPKKETFIDAAKVDICFETDISLIVYVLLGWEKTETKGKVEFIRFDILSIHK